MAPTTSTSKIYPWGYPKRPKRRGPSKVRGLVTLVVMLTVIGGAYLIATHGRARSTGNEAGGGVVTTQFHVATDWTIDNSLRVWWERASDQDRVMLCQSYYLDWPAAWAQAQHIDAIATALPGAEQEAQATLSVLCPTVLPPDEADYCYC